MGTAEFGLPGLRLLLENKYEIVGVVTNADKPSGRGQKVTCSPVKEFAIERNLPLLQPLSLKDESFINQLTTLKADVFVVVAFRILPAAVFQIPKHGTFNLHASLLPQYRGAAPIQWAIINGERETGVTTFFLDEKVDTGNIILQARLPIRENETAGELHDRLAEIGGEIILHTVRLIELGSAPRRQQDNSVATPAPKIFKESCEIDWKRKAGDIHNFVRGLSPVPCAFTYHRGTMLRIFRTQLADEHHKGNAGEVLKSDKRFLIATGTGVVELIEVQQQGKKKLRAEEFLRGYRITEGEILGTTA